jgi:fatty acid desaturase
MNSKKTECFPKDKIYSRFVLGLDLAKLKELEKINQNKTIFGLMFLYLMTAILIFFSIKLTNFNYFFYIPCIFLIAGRQGGFVQLVHEASHFLVSKSEKFNDFFGNYLCAYPIGVNLKGFRSGHNNHHVNTATPDDSPTDLDKYKIVDTKKFDLYKLFLKDLIGISALEVFFSYGKNKTETVNIEKKSKKEFFLTLTKLSLVQLFILSLFGFNVLNYFLFWLFPLMSPHMFLMRIRGLAEHGQSNQLGCVAETNSAGTFYTRSFMTNVSIYKSNSLVFLEKILIGSFYVHYHHEHHIFPKVPWYNLKKLNALISKNITEHNSSETYRKGYFSAAFIN